MGQKHRNIRIIIHSLLTMMLSSHFLSYLSSKFSSGFFADGWYFLSLSHTAYYSFSCNLYVECEEENGKGHRCCRHHDHHNPQPTIDCCVTLFYLTGK